MSKTNTSSRLLAILRFTIPSKSSRTLNATQAYDKTSSGITLASATGRLVDKSAAVKSYTQPIGSSADVGLRAANVGLIAYGAQILDMEQRNSSLYEMPAGTRTAELSLKARTAELSLKGGTLDRKGGNGNFWNFASFTGSAGYAAFEANTPGLLKSKATNPNTTFYGGISVATGDYRKWQGKYAVLKLNTTTGKGVLRIYEDE